MKINVDRLCELAGLESDTSNLLSEASNRSYHDDPSLSKERDVQFGKNQLSEGDSEDEEEDNEDMDEMLEIDEVMLVQELRRAKAHLAESKNRAEKLQESELKSIIESEISNVIDELNLTGGWIYGNKRPSASKKGYVHQGSFLKGIGFK